MVNGFRGLRYIYTVYCGTSLVLGLGTIPYRPGQGVSVSRVSKKIKI